MDSPLKDTGPTGYDGFDDVYLGSGMQAWVHPEQDGNSGSYGSGGGGGGGSSNGYHYDWATGHYEDGWGNVVSWNEVYNNYVLPNANYTAVVTGNTTIDRLTSLVNIFYDVKKLLNADYSISIGVGNDPITIVGAGSGSLDWSTATNSQKIIQIMNGIRNANRNGQNYIDMRELFSNFPRYGTGVDIAGDINIGSNSLIVYMNIAIYNDMKIGIYSVSIGQVGPFQNINVNGIIKNGYWDSMELNRENGNLPILLIETNTNFDIFYNYLYNK